MSQWDGETTGTTSNERPRLLRGWIIVLSTCAVLSLFLGGLESTAQLDKDNSQDDFPEIFEDVSKYLKYYYLDLERITPRPLIEKAFGAIENAVDEIYIENSDPKNPIITVHVESKAESFNLDNLEDLDDAVKMLEGVFDFIKKNYRGETPLNEIRYAAANGFLTGIDPHTLVFSPEDFKDFSVHIEGEICGVGMYVGTREGKLTVIEVLKGTPAFKAGFKKSDLIAKIGDESTINMTVSEAVEKIRGVCKTSVTLSVKRPSAADAEMLETIPITVERDRVVIKSVESTLITDWSSAAVKSGSDVPVTEVRVAEGPWQGGVGYVQVINFDKNTTRSLQENLDRLQVQNGGKPLAGLILDLRNNSGGLLTQAVDMCDLFLDSGSIVITASKREKLNTQEAKESGDEPDYPIVVLSNEASASGAEIVIGALQKNDRAIVVGTRTFGKGSVQQLHQLHHNAQLKITVSEYLIPGKISIQENGVVPNIMALAVVDDGELDLFQNERSLTERNYERHIVSRYAKEESPDYTLRYLLDPVENDPYNDRFMSGELEPGKDKLVQIALSVLKLAGKPYKPGAILREKRGDIEKLKDSLFGDIEGRLKEKGIDWSAGPGAPPTRIEAGELELVLSREFIQEPSKEKDDPIAVNKVRVTAKLTNKGKQTFYRMKGLSRSDYFLYKDKELLFGKLEPGQTLERSVKVRLPYFPFTRNDIFTVELSATGDLPNGDGQAADAVLLSAGIPIEIKDTGRPSFAYAAEILEAGKEGEAPKPISSLHEGCDAILKVKIKNSGNAPAYKGVAILRNETGRQVFLNKGRIEFSNLAPQAESEVEFRFEVRSGEPVDEYKFDLMVADSYSNAAISRKFTVPGKGKGLTKPFPNGVEFSAPTITASLVDPVSRETVITTGKDTVNLEAMIRSQSPDHFKAWIFNSVVGDHELTADKIFFANSEGESQLKIATSVPLKKGINLFTVVSNGRDGLESRQNIVVRRE